MGIIPLHEYRQRFDPDISTEIIQRSMAKKVSMEIKCQEQAFFSRVLHADFKAESPFMVFDSLMPPEGNELANSRSEVAVSCSYLHEGTIYHCRFKTIFWAVGKHKGMSIVYGTPPLDSKIRTEHFSATVTRSNMLHIQIPLFSDTLRLPVAKISKHALAFEDRLVSDSMPAVQNLNRATLEFDDGSEIVFHGDFKSRGANVVEFIFDNLSKEAKSRLDAYLENMFAVQGAASEVAEDDEEERKKKTKVKRICSFILSSDEAYIDQLRSFLNTRGIDLLALESTDGMYKEVARQAPRIVLIDNQHDGLDLWEVSRGYQAHIQENEKAPPLVLLSDDLSEDVVVYAQYCNIKHVYGRTSFLTTAFKDLGVILGVQDIGGDAEETVQTVVIIDDDQNVTFPLEHALKQSGFQAKVAKTGSEGVRLAKDYQPVCIILEIAIRSGDGMNACRMLKKMPFTQKVPMIILTASRDVQDQQCSKQYGVEKFLNKPIDTHKLLNSILDLVGK